MQACLSHASNIVAADKCTDAFLSLLSVDSSVAAVAIVGAIAFAAIFATVTFRNL